MTFGIVMAILLDGFSKYLNVEEDVNDEIKDLESHITNDIIDSMRKDNEFRMLENESNSVKPEN